MVLGFGSPSPRQTVQQSDESTQYKPSFKAARQLAWNALSRHPKAPDSSPDAPPTSHTQRRFASLPAIPPHEIAHEPETYSPRSPVKRRNERPANQELYGDASRPSARVFQQPMRERGRQNTSIATHESSQRSIPLSIQAQAPLKPHPAVLIERLEGMMDTNASLCQGRDGIKEVRDRLNITHLVGMYDAEKRDGENRELWLGGAENAIKTMLLKPNPGSRKLAVFNEPLNKICIYASTPTLLSSSSQKHILILPTLVVSCIEELYRTGIYQPHLFRALPNRNRLLELISIFDMEEGNRNPPQCTRGYSRTGGEREEIGRGGFGAQMSLHLETTPDICALLSTFLSSLPHSLLPPSIFEALWAWCVSPPPPIPPSRNSRRSISPNPATMAQIHGQLRVQIAQLVLQLVPQTHLSLLVYLLSFFSQVVLVSEENGVGIDDVARMFGSKLFGNGGGAKGGGGRSKGRGEEMMCWFMKRWGVISDGLYEWDDRHSQVGSEDDDYDFINLKREGGIMMNHRDSLRLTRPENKGDEKEHWAVPPRVARRDSPYPYVVRGDADGEPQFDLEVLLRPPPKKGTLN